MTQFKYAAKEPSGNTVTGTIEASNKADALNALRKQNLVIMKLDEAGAMGGKKLSEITCLSVRQRSKPRRANW